LSIVAGHAEETRELSESGFGVQLGIMIDGGPVGDFPVSPPPPPPLPAPSSPLEYYPAAAGGAVVLEGEQPSLLQQMSETEQNLAAVAAVHGPAQPLRLTSPAEGSAYAPQQLGTTHPASVPVPPESVLLHLTAPVSILGLQDSSSTGRAFQSRQNEGRKKHKLEAASTNADGNCQFACIAKVVYGDEALHPRVRSEICDYLEAEVGSSRLQESQFVSVNGNVGSKAWLEEMRTQHTYGDEQCLVAAAAIYKMSEFVLDTQPNHTTLIFGLSGSDTPDPFRTMMVEYQGNGRTGHYVLLQQKGDATDDAQNTHMHMHVHLYLYLYVYTHTYTKHIHTHMFICIQVYVYVYIYTFAYAYVYTYTCIHMHMYVYMDSYIYIYI